MKKIYENYGLTIMGAIWALIIIVLSMYSVDPMYVSENGTCKCPAVIREHDYGKHTIEIRKQYRYVIAVNRCGDGKIRNEKALHALKVYEDAYAWHMKHDKR